MTEDLSDEQERLIVWRDYFELLEEGIIWNNGDNKGEWSDKKIETVTWIQVVIIELESDVMHLESDQPEYCRWGDAKDLTGLDGNIDVRNE